MQIIIVGNSAAGLSALQHFRSFDSDSRITLVSAEPGPAYSRVLLPYYLRGKVPYENLFIRSEEDYRRLDVKTEFGVSVRNLDSERRSVLLDDGRTVAFDRLLVATGSRPFLPPIQGLEGPEVCHLWTLADVRRLDTLLRPGRRALVLGSGFVALQGAWAALQRGLKVTIYELLPHIMPTALDETAAELLRRRIEDHGVEVRLGTTTEAVQRSSDGSLKVLAKGRLPLDVDIVIVGAGVRPNVEFLVDSPVEIERGILVNERMETNVPGIYAAGDVARGPTAFGQPHETHALWPTAVEHGKIAGTNLAGRTLRYRGSLSMNVTEMFGMTVASMGQFSETENLNSPNGGEVSSYVEGGSAAERYLKILFKDQIPVGAVALGTAEDAVLLGRLRPWIRWKRRIPDFPGFLEGRYILPEQVA